MTPLVHSIPEVCSLADAGRTSVYEAINNGKLIAHKRGSRTIIFSSDLQRWLNSLPKIEAKNAKQQGSLSAGPPQEGSIAQGAAPERKRRSKA